MRRRAAEIAQPGRGHLAGGGRIHPAGHELADAHLEMKGELLVDLLVDGHTPQPRPQGALHVANSTFDTPAENRRHVASSAASCVRPAAVSR